MQGRVREFYMYSTRSTYPLARWIFIINYYIFQLFKLNDPARLPGLRGYLPRVSKMHHFRCSAIREFRRIADIDF